MPDSCCSLEHWSSGRGSNSLQHSSSSSSSSSTPGHQCFSDNRQTCTSPAQRLTFCCNTTAVHNTPVTHGPHRSTKLHFVKQSRDTRNSTAGNHYLRTKLPALVQCSLLLPCVPVASPAAAAQALFVLLILIEEEDGQVNWGHHSCKVEEVGWAVRRWRQRRAVCIHHDHLHGIHKDSQVLLRLRHCMHVAYASGLSAASM